MSMIRVAAIVLVGGLALIPARTLCADVGDVEKKMDSERVSLDLKEASAKDLFRIYKDLLGVEVAYQCSEDKMLSFAFEGLRVRTSLDAICESAGLDWSLEAGTPPVLKITCGQAPSAGGERRVVKIDVQGGPPRAGEPEARAEVRVKRTKAGGSDAPPSTDVSIDLKDAQLADTLKMAARLLDAKLLMDTSLGGKTITLKMEAVPVQTFLDAVCKQAGATWNLKAGQPPTLEVSRAR